MRAHRFDAEQWVPLPLPEVFEFFAAAENLERITPPWLRFVLVDQTPAGAVNAGTQISYRLRLHGVPLRWVSLIEEFEPERVFLDRQLVGPYRLWVHRHTFAAAGEGTIIGDHVLYQLPLGALGVLALPFVRHDVRRIFAYRHKAVAELLG